MPGPVRADREHRQVAGPVREPKFPGRLLRVRNEAVVRQHPLPGLERPVRAVGRLARRDLPGERRAVVGAAPRAECLPGVRVRLAPSAGVVEPKLHLRPGMRRSDGIDRVPGEHVLQLARGRVRDECFTLRVHGEPHVVGVPVDQLRSVRARCEHAGDADREQVRNTATRLSSSGNECPIGVGDGGRPRSLARVPSFEVRPVSVSRL